jgi:hypothetical protein
MNQRFQTLFNLRAELGRERSYLSKADFSIGSSSPRS